jgi:hypothetical protein
MALTPVVCAHCDAPNEINVPDDYPAGPLKWECTPCGGVCSVDIPGPVQVSAGDGGAGGDGNG